MSSPRFALALLAVASAGPVAGHGSARTTCQALKEHFKNQSCCGQPAKTVSFLPLSQATLADSSVFYWTKAGLEQIPFGKWEHFSPGDAQYRPFAADIPWPGDTFTAEHLGLWREHVAGTQTALTYADLLAGGFISTAPHAEPTMPPLMPFFMVPPRVEYSTIDYRLHVSADNFGSRDLNMAAIRGPLEDLPGFRLRLHHYRYPDQCDAPPIALEGFLRQQLLDQVGVFFHPEPRIGLFQDLYNDIPRREFNPKDLAIARWYASRQAETYVSWPKDGVWVYPFEEVSVDARMRAFGLDPTDSSMNVSTAIGLGNVVGKRAAMWLMENDMLQKSIDWVDEEGLQAIDDFHMNNLTWSSWVPSLAGSNRYRGVRPGIVTRQTFVSPSLGVRSFMYMDDAELLSLGFESSVPFYDQSDAAFLLRSREFLGAVKSLTDRQKAAAEMSNNKIMSTVWMHLAFQTVLKRVMADATPAEYLDYHMDFSTVTHGCGAYGGLHAAWRHKRTRYAGRPQTVVRRLAKMNSSFAAEFPEAAAFTSMIPAGDHPEFPSGSAALYNGFVAAGDHWFAKHFPQHFSMESGNKASQNTGPLTLPFPVDTFYWSNGPSAPVVLQYASLDEWVQELPMSRVWGGVHFKEAGDAGLALGAKAGEVCFHIQEGLKAGNATATYTYSGRATVSRFCSA